jgi:hypothetical protein
MAFRDDCPQGQSQDLTCAEASGKVVIDKFVVKKLNDLLINSIYSVHISRLSEIFLTSLHTLLAENSIANRDNRVNHEFSEKLSLLLESYQDTVPKLLKTTENCLGEAIDIINPVVSASKKAGNNG